MKRNGSILPVDLEQFLFRGAVQRRYNEADRRQFLLKLRIAQQRGIGNQTGFQCGIMIVNMPDDPSDAGMESRFADAGKGNIVDFRMFLQHGIQFRDDCIGWKIFAPFASQMSGCAAFTVDTVHGTGLVRQQVNAQRKAETPGRNGSEHTFCLYLLHVCQKILCI